MMQEDIMKRRNLLMILIMAVVLLTAVVLAGCGGGSTERADDALVGKYNSVAAEALGITMVGDEAGGFGIDLQSGGKGQMTLDDGTTSSLKWKNDDTTITLTIEKTDVTGELIGTDAFKVADMLGQGADITFAKEGSAAADPALYLPENEKALIREWKSVEASDILGDPVDPSVMAADALSMTFHGDHTMDISIAGDEYKGIDWSSLGTYGSADTDEIDISWDQEDEGLKVDYKKDGTYFTFFCPTDPASYVPAAAPAVQEEEPDASEEAGEETDSEEESQADGGYVSANTVYGDYWDRDWFGGYLLDGCSGAYEEMEGYWWDCLAAINVYADDTGAFIMWDNEMTPDNPTCVCKVSFTAGTTDAGCMVSEDGSFWNADCHIGHADWIVDPGASEVSACEHMICIEGEYEDADGSFHYYIFLKPWGMDWEDVKTVNEHLIPYAYDWYLSKKDGPMPMAIGE